MSKRLCGLIEQSLKYVHHGDGTKTRQKLHPNSETYAPPMFEVKRALGIHGDINRMIAMLEGSIADFEITYGNSKCFQPAGHWGSNSFGAFMELENGKVSEDIFGVLATADIKAMC